MWFCALADAACCICFALRVVCHVSAVAIVRVCSVARMDAMIRCPLAYSPLRRNRAALRLRLRSMAPLHGALYVAFGSVPWRIGVTALRRRVTSFHLVFIKVLMVPQASDADLRALMIEAGCALDPIQPMQATMQPGDPCNDCDSATMRPATMRRRDGPTCNDASCIHAHAHRGSAPCAPR